MNRRGVGQAGAVVEHGWLAGVRRAPSTHADERPATCRVELVVIHCVSLPPGEFGGSAVEALFTGRLDYSAHPYYARLRGLKVAPHLFVRRDGELVQFVSFDRRAWHAGRSSWRNRRDCNDYSVGIELEGTSDVAYTDAQYAALTKVLPALLDAYPGIGEEGVAGHSDIAPGRKTDPGDSFDWQHLARALGRAGYNLRRPQTRREGFGA